MKLALAMFALSLLIGCASLASLVAEQIPALVEPDHVVLEEGRSQFSYSYCAYGQCVAWTQEVQVLEFEGFECVVMYVAAEYPDGTRNDWIWPLKGSDDRCLTELIRAAELDE